MRSPIVAIGTTVALLATAVGATSAAEEPVTPVVLDPSSFHLVVAWGRVEGICGGESYIYLPDERLRSFVEDAEEVVLRDLGLEPVQHAWLYLPVMLGSIALMLPLVIVGERRGLMKPVFIGAVGCLMIAQLALGLTVDNFWGFVVALTLFFTAVNLLEAALPSLVSKIAPVEAKGTAMGVYSTSQFTGAFIGGVVGGWAHHQFGLAAVFEAGAVAAAIWLLLAFGMRRPGRYVSRLVNLGDLADPGGGDIVRRLQGVPGVVEAVVVADEGVAYLKVDRDRLDSMALDEIVARPA